MSDRRPLPFSFDYGTDRHQPSSPRSLSNRTALSTDSIFPPQVHEASGRRYANAQSHAWASLTHPEDSSSCATAVLRASGRAKGTTRGSTGGRSCRLDVPLVLRTDSTAMAMEETAQDRAIPLDQGPLLGWPSSFRSFLGPPAVCRGGYGGREASLAERCSSTVRCAITCGVLFTDECLFLFSATGGSVGC